MENLALTSKDLSKQRAKLVDLELSKEQWNKISSEPAPGKRVTIKWNDNVLDYGYIFTLPECDVNDGYDSFIHIPHPDNSSGIDDAPPVWIYLKDLLRNDNLSHVKVKEGAVIEF